MPRFYFLTVQRENKFHACKNTKVNIKFLLYILTVYIYLAGIKRRIETE
jgi:hypothetical protein